MKYNALKCGKCADTIHSTFRHDFRKCKCEACFIDGGLDYFRAGYLPGTKVTYGTYDSETEQFTEGPKEETK